MRNYVSIASVLVLLVGCGLPDEHVAQLKSAVHDAPRLEVTPGAVFFGQICAGRSAQQNVTLYNNGDDDLLIQTLRIVDGPQFRLVNRPALPARIVPGAELHLIVRFTPQVDSVDPYTGILRIGSNDPGRPNTHVRLMGISVPATLTAVPRQIDVGDLRNGDYDFHQIVLRNNSACPAEIAYYEIVGPGEPLLWVSDLPEGSIPPGGRRTMTLEVDCFRPFNIEATLRLRDPDDRSIGSVLIIGECSR